MRWLFAISIGISILFQPTAAHANFAEAFADSFSRAILPLSWDRLYQVANATHIAAPSRLETWGLINSDAQASYNSLLNTLVLKPEALGFDENGRYRLATINELKASAGAAYQTRVVTIIHELAHAEYDHFVQDEATVDDLFIHRMMNNEIEPWLKRNHPDLFWLSRSTALSEIFAYYHGDLMQAVMSDIDEILVANGFNRFSDRCFAPPQLKELARTMSQADFSRLIALGHDVDEPYRRRFKLEAVWVKGEEVSLTTANSADPFLPRWQEALSDHFTLNFALPRTKRQLVARLNTLTQWQTQIRRCHDQIWASQNGIKVADRSSWH